MDYKIKLHEYRNELPLKNRIARVTWYVVYILFFRPFKTRIFNFWRVFILRLFGAKIGNHCYVSSSVRIWAPWNLEMSSFSMLASRVYCYNPAKITIDSETVISEGVLLCTASHDITSVKHTLIVRPIIIKDQVWIAVDAFIMMGVTIGQGAVVGARAAVFNDVEPWSVVGGNPAKFIKKREIK